MSLRLLRKVLRLSGSAAAGTARTSDQTPATAPDDGDSLLPRGSALLASGRYREARDALRRVAALGPPGAALCLDLGWSCRYCGFPDEAESWMRKATEIEPEKPESHVGLGSLLQMRRRPAEAAAAFERARALRGHDIDALIGLGTCKLEQGEPSSGEACFRRAIEIDAECTSAWVGLCATLARQFRHAEAVAACARAEALGALKDESSDGFVERLVALTDLGRTREVIALCEERLPERPVALGHVAYAVALLRGGRLREGWSHFEFRWLVEPGVSMRTRFDRPAWSGQDLRGKTILLRAEQGFGDAIQFLRFVPAKRVVLSFSCTCSRGSKVWSVRSRPSIAC